MRTPWIFFILGILLLATGEILKVYFIMPFPGSQLQNNVELAYNINRYLWIYRLLCGLLVLFCLPGVFKAPGLLQKGLALTLIFLLGVVFYFTTFVMLADKMFLQPTRVVMVSTAQSNIAGNALVIGIVENGEAKAYPVNIIGYHHQVRDTLDNQPVIITYCTVCRTGRVFRPIVNGKVEAFRLVGMDQFNAMFEDATTHSWWRQATGECCAGPLKGQKLPEVPTQQMTLESWAHLYPQSKVLQPDSTFARHYNALTGYDNGTLKGSLEGTDTVSGHAKSWVVVVITQHGEKMYDWNTLKKHRVINDTIENEPVLLTLENDEVSFHALSRQVNDSTLAFSFDSKTNGLIDNTTQSVWNMGGQCTEGSMKGSKLKFIRSYQEFLHSYTTFPTTNVVQLYQ